MKRVPRMCGMGMPSSAVGAPSSLGSGTGEEIVCGGGVSRYEMKLKTTEMASETRKVVNQDMMPPIQSAF
ncbi:MAG: hypothetical protein PUB01_08100 [Desulfovibrionaceae bacterium]|nr:hypothetical protein [Desulfovibrionaceae bacterium]